MRKATTVVSTIFVSLLLGACDDPNCFAGECAVGPQGEDEPSEEFREYFFDLAFGAQSADVDALLRFPGEVTLRMRGSPTSRDRAEVADIADDLHELTGRDISVSDSAGSFEIHFIPRADFDEFLGDVPEEFDGYVQFLYQVETGVIARAVALISTDMPAGSDERDHVTRQVITRGFGMLNVSDRYPTSIFYSGPSTVTTYTPIDEFVITTVYDARLQSAMTRAEVREAMGW